MSEAPPNNHFTTGEVKALLENIRCEWRPVIEGWSPLVSQVDLIAATVSRHEGRLDRLEASHRLLHREMVEVKADIKVLKADVAELKADVTILKADVAQLKTDVAELKADVTILKADVAQLKTDVAELKADVTVLKAGMHDVKTDNALFHNRLRVVEFRVGLS